MYADLSPDLDNSGDDHSEYMSLARTSTPPTSLRASISPPPSRTKRNRIDDRIQDHTGGSLPTIDNSLPNLAAIEAGAARIQDHLEYFSSHLSKSIRTPYNGAAQPPTLSIPAFKNLYRRNQHPHGRHFVIHQHDHPVAGVHYDLRLQVNETSSISWAIMYGLPGNVNSRRLNRNATETRVHNVWNHLIETASATTGSLLIWDTGEYEMLPYRESTEKETDDELSSDSDAARETLSELSDSEKLHIAFQNRKIRIRLHGTHLPPSYTLSIRLLSSENRSTQPPKPSRKRRRKPPTSFNQPQVTPPTSDLDDDEVVPDAHPTSMDASASALEREIAEQEDKEVRRTNAYPGARNSIGSVHQRRWFLSMDRWASGFRPLGVAEGGGKGGRRKWVRRGEGGRELGFESFFVMGREVVGSVVTGRSADDVMADEGVEGFVGRRGWRAVVE